VLAYGAFVLLIGYFSNQPSYRHLPEGSATIKLSLRHAGQILGECRERSASELADLPASMRVATVCPRKRSPLELELWLDGERVYSQILPARGLHQDGRASIYRRLSVPAGLTAIKVRLKDHVEADDFQYSSQRQLNLPAGSNLVIDFDEQERVFDFVLAGSDQGPALQYPLNDLEAGDGEGQDDHKIDKASVGKGRATTLLDQPDNPVRYEIQPNGDHGE